MGGFAAGTDAYEEGRDRRARHVQQRRMNVGDLLNGFGLIAQQLGAASRARQAQAQDALYAERLGQLMSGQPAGDQTMVGDPYSQPAMALPGDRGGDSRTVSGGHVATPSFEQTITADMNAPRPGMGQNLVNAFTGGTSKPSLRPDQAMALFQAMQGQRSERKQDKRYEEGIARELARDAESKRRYEESEKPVALARAKDYEAQARKEASGSGSPAIRPNEAYDNFLKIDATARDYEDKATKLGAYNVVSLSDVAIQKLMDSQDSTDREVGTALQGTKPADRVAKIDELAKYYKGRAEQFRSHPAYIAGQNFMRNDYPKYLGGMSGQAGGRGGVDMVNAITEKLRAAGADPSNPTDDEYIEAKNAVPHELGGR